ncbi:MAG TPA: serine/threonine-protein kinase, partial [Blastocatellia bacterium]|nr:serine/threonine-protein kinase [Blastocatellia bacterium]
MNNTFDCKDSSYGTAPAIEPIAADGGKRVRAALESRFEIVRTVSESDIHCYYLARSLAGAEVPVSSDLVRVKVLSRSAASDRRQVELFTVEARAAASLSHKNILKTTEAEELNGVWFSAIEEKPGAETLQEYLRRKGWLDSDEALRIIQQVAGALEYAHDRGVLHLTLEAEKVLLNGEGDVFLTGFGIASTDDLAWAHQERSRRCSPRYISPEQVLGRGTDKRTDLYLLGVIIFEMLTDRAPFEAEDPVSLRLKHLSKPPQPPHMFRPNLSPAASQIVLDLLGKKPAERPATIGDLMRALEQCAVAGLLTDEQPDEPSLFSEPDPEPAAFEQDLSYWEEEPKEDLRNVDIIEEPDIEEPISIDTEGEERGPVLIEPSLLPVKDGAASSVRFVWIIVVLILGMGLFWAIRAARFQGGQNPIASNAAAETLSNDEPAAVRSGTDTPKMEPESPAA